MSMGSIIVSILYDQFLANEVETLQIPNLPSSDTYTLEEEKSFLNRTLLLWNEIELFFHVGDGKIQYDRDDRAAETFCILLQGYYINLFNVQVERMNEKLKTCRKEASEYRWNDNLILQYSTYYLMRQNLLSHIRYLQEINPKLLGVKSDRLDPIDKLEYTDVKREEPKSSFFRKCQYGLVYGLWKLITI